MFRKRISAWLVATVHLPSAVSQILGGVVFSRTQWSRIAFALSVVCLCAAIASRAQEPINRKIKSQVSPTYPEVARRMGLIGTVKIQVRVDKTGNVKEAKIVGGHPVLANAALDAVLRRKYEPAPEETVGIVEFRFTGPQ
jgi:TonB family protein